MNPEKTSTKKACSICGELFPTVEFSYGNRENRSYCQRCNSEEKRAYSRGGKSAAREYRNLMRAGWTQSK